MRRIGVTKEREPQMDADARRSEHQSAFICVLPRFHCPKGLRGTAARLPAAGRAGRGGYCLSRLAAALALVAGLMGTAQADEVLLLDGSKFSNCKVLKENAREVQVDLDGNGAADKTVPSEEVADIQYADRSVDYLQAELFVKSGSYARAVEAFQAIAQKAARPSWLATYADYYRAVALERWAASEPAKAPTAVQALSEFITRHGDTRFIYQARLSLAEAYLVQGKLAEVRRLAEAVVGEKPNTRWAHDGRLLLARVKLNEKDAQGAARDFDAVLAAIKDKRSPIWARATVGKGLALLAQDKLDDAERLLMDLIETTQDSATRARAYNALGDGHFKRGEYAEARLKYLRVVLLYFQADAVEHAKALYQAAECFRRLGEQERADALFKELVRRYPGTPWAAKSPVKPEAVEEPSVSGGGRE